MSEIEIGVLVALATIFLLGIGVPIAFALAGVAVTFLLFGAGPASLTAVPRVFFEEVNGFALLALPMFILLGGVVGSSRAASDIYEAAHRWLAAIPGGLAIANIIACGLFAAICGSSPATAAAIGKSGIPQMRKRGISSHLAAGAICAGGTLGILIPPSITLILYGVATETSIGSLFIAGVIPGLLLVVLFSIYACLASVFARRGVKATPQERYSLRSKLSASARVVPFITIIVLILVALYGGIATPSEVAAVAALLAIVMVLFLYRPSRSEWQLVATELVRDTAMLFMIIAASGLFSYMLSLLYVTQSLGELLVAAQLDRWAFFAAVVALLLVLGCFLPPVALILMVMPVIQPALEAYEFNLIWFGIIMTITMEIGLITPPVGVNLFVVHGIAPDLSLRTILEGSLPFVLLMICTIVLFCVFPGLITWLPTMIRAS